MAAYSIATEYPVKKRRRKNELPVYEEGRTMYVSADSYADAERIGLSKLDKKRKEFIVRISLEQDAVVLT